MARPDIVDIISLKLVAYGNTVQNSDGSYTCQHGEGECTSDALELCTQYLLSGNVNSIESGDTSLQAWPFILCMEEAEGNPDAGEGCFDSTMSSTNVTWSEVQGCYNDYYDTVMTAAAKATPAHDFVPWVYVDGEVIEHNDLLQKYICDAYTGTKPESCKNLLKDGTSVCFNKK